MPRDKALPPGLRANPDRRLGVAVEYLASALTAYVVANPKKSLAVLLAMASIFAGGGGAIGLDKLRELLGGAPAPATEMTTDTLKEVAALQAQVENLQQTLDKFWARRAADRERDDARFRALEAQP